MSNPARRHGVALPEVLVAAALLGVGVAGCLATLSTSVRLRATATAREALAAAALSRLAWFEAVACAANDTVIDVDGPEQSRERFTLTRDAFGAELRGSVRALRAGSAIGLSIEARQACD